MWSFDVYKRFGKGFSSEGSLVRDTSAPGSFLKGYLRATHSFCKGFGVTETY